MKNWKIIVGVMAIFALGAAAGALVTHRVTQRRIHAILRGGPQATDLMVRRLTWDLRLTPEQRQQVREIVRDTQRQLAAARQQPEPRFRPIFLDMERRIRAVLTPEQQAKYDQLMAERRARLGLAPAGN